MSSSLQVQSDEERLAKLNALHIASLSPLSPASPAGRRSNDTESGSVSVSASGTPQSFQAVMGAAEAVLGEVDLQDLESLILWCRGAAALQPDATSTPLQRCEVSGAWLVNDAYA